MLSLMVKNPSKRLSPLRKPRRPKRHLYQQLWNAGAAEERQRIARDLHDTVIQTLYSANLSANSLMNRQEQAPDDEGSKVHELGELIQRALDETRILLLELRSPLASEGAIGGQLEFLAHDFTERTQIPVTVQLVGGDLFLPRLQITVAQIVREALNNVAKHAYASEVRLELHCERDGGTVAVRDNGRGFAPRTDAKGSYGLAIMRERAQSINAHLNIVSEPGSGTDIILTWGSYGKPAVRS